MATFTNRATLSYNGGTIDSNTVTGTFLETLAITKTATVESYSTGSCVTYAVSLVNSGSTPFTGLTLTDDLGGYDLGGTTVYPLSYVDGSILYYINGALQADPEIGTTPPLTISGVSVPAGGNSLLVYTVDVGAAAPPIVGGTIVNTATVSGGGLPEDLNATETITAENQPALSITKTLNPTAVPENGTITYSFLIENRGNTDAVATDNLTVSDVFDPILTITSVTLNGVALTAGTDYTYDEATGTFATVPGLITVPAATFTQDSDGNYTILPGSAVLVVTGTI
ncbi:MAG: hypothetical protein E7637_01005 [Ruminococcaceae bacterium]|nr:hypothetical protein [Oscillospiraceae bacterium]